MTITRISKTIRITKPCGCSASLSMSLVYVDGVLQSSPEKIKELSYA